MSKQDRQIDDVLKALRQAEPRPGLEDQVLANLRAAQAAASTPYIFRGQFATLFSEAPMPWLAAAMLLVLLAGALILHQSAPSDKRPSEEAGSASVFSPGPRLKIETWGTPGIQSAQPQRLPHVSQRHGFHFVASATPGSFCAETSDSFPPPPLPLTEQERLMLRIVRHEPAQQLAQLSKPVRDAAFQHDKDSVAEFFAPPPAFEQESATDDSPTGQQ